MIQSWYKIRLLILFLEQCCSHIWVYMYIRGLSQIISRVVRPGKSHDLSKSYEFSLLPSRKWKLLQRCTTVARPVVRIIVLHSRSSRAMEMTVAQRSLLLHDLMIESYDIAKCHTTKSTTLRQLARPPQPKQPVVQHLIEVYRWGK